MKLIVATRNQGKLAEIRAILDLPAADVLSVDDVPGLPEVEEDGATFVENAAKKAREISAASGLPALADDSGLCVHALGGAPGVYSARYAGEDANDAANNAKLLRELQTEADRSACFRCALALADPQGGIRTLEAECPGRIIHEPRGANGFGYDPLFVPEGHERTFAELPSEVKHRISHRARALAMAKKAWAVTRGC